ncbi:hypothetical protein [Cupriavidus gilardii]|uniref:hypothetical protein n=1 Tax=Cupriavidus gilardii TaxID=82541 RepID=UPI0021B42199|nr:hypothetical protein [Cupriavidus gilardii]UXC38258.1 hypothetical protein N4G38_24670 [Cupriavidus gilardii]
MLKRLYAELVLWLRRPVRLELDASSIVVARPGDVVVLRLSRELRPELLAGFLSSMRKVAAGFPGVKFVVVQSHVEVDVSSGAAE